MKLVVDSVPRPEVVKRVRPENRPSDTGANSNGTPKPDAMDIDQPAPQQGNRDNLNVPSAPKGPSAIPSSLNDSARTSRPPTPNQPMAARLAAANKPIPSSPRAALNSLDQRPQRLEPQQAMPPPSTPSQTMSAQELRETAKRDRGDERPSQPPTEPRGQAAAPPAPSPRRRSPSPTSRPGTRPPSQDSRASGDRRSARETGSADKSEGKRERESSRRESTRGERRTRDTDRDGDDRDRGRDRHGDRDRRGRDKDRDRERDRDHRDRDSHRERERERDRDRDRDRHRRDEKDRDRDRTATDDRGLPSRPETGRDRRGQHDDSLGKRRRGADDEADRSSKRSSRDGKGLTVDTKLGDKRIPEGPASAKSLPPSTPSAPRAMTAAGDSARKGDGPGRDREWKRDQPPHAPPTGPSSGSQNGTVPEGGSLRSRISGPADRDARPPPQAPSADRKVEASRDDGRDGSRKRTLSERERDAPDAPPANEPAPQHSKRPKLIRDRYATASGPSNGFAKKVLPIDPHAAEKAKSARKD
ncbi:hypothetical protein C8Q73DRAFT_334410 [Cubamyces lactineus]|nr:hypothetical protein C8Q73DRAFT_334410 [Cubamyces lactineus]